MKQIIYPIVIIAAILTLYFWRSPRAPKIEVIDPLTTKTKEPQPPIDENNLKFTGRDDTDLLTLLHEKANVQINSAGEITNINDKINSDEYNWNICINGEPIGGLPREIETYNDDQIELKYEAVPKPVARPAQPEEETEEEPAETETPAENQNQ